VIIEAYRDALVRGAVQLAIPLPDPLADAMSAHYALVRKWAERINLTTILDPQAAASRHGVDSLLFVAHLPKRTGVQCVDVGSGAGFPGLVVALARPDLSITLLEPKRKRASFLRVALAELGRNDVAVVEGRLDEPGARIAGPFPTEVIMSRATIPPLDLVERSGPRLLPGGRIIVTSGQGAPEVAAMKRAADRAGLAHQERFERKLPTGESRIIDVFHRTA
jgi:16S rRNA (guanine527-N7)-methyltransferase